MPHALCELVEMTEPCSTTRAEKPPGLLPHYEAIALASSAMLAAARSGDWFDVARQEERCCALIAGLKAAADSACRSLNPAEETRRVQLLRQILSDDAQIRGHAEPWIEPLAPFISSPRALGTSSAT